ncbi:unnamed protein product [Rotaria sp. Silwood1]|nr:unnamed protein product [Rotaria sp. Silwood1]CAF1605840.1 unnamed protein product [Rotaria sp. Silwood1]
MECILLAGNYSNLSEHGIYNIIKENALYLAIGQCYVYSYPFTLTSYECITNNFPGGLFTYVREVSLYDKHLFEHKHFLQIQKSFSFMEDLTVTNWKP